MSYGVSIPPPWARWVAADRDGETFFFSHRPRLGESSWYRTEGKAGLAGITNVNEQNWRLTLAQLSTDEAPERVVEPDSISGLLARGDKAGALTKFRQFRDALHVEVEAYQQEGREATLQ